MTEKTIEMWLPVNETKVTVIDGKVTVWDEMTMEKRLVQKPAGFAPTGSPFAKPPTETQA